jgi:hypothetical protein
VLCSRVKLNKCLLDLFVGIGRVKNKENIPGWPSPTDSEVKRKVDISEEVGWRRGG